MCVSCFRFEGRGGSRTNGSALQAPAPSSAKRVALYAIIFFLGGAASVIALVFGGAGLLHAYANTPLSQWMAHAVGTIGSLYPPNICLWVLAIAGIIGIALLIFGPIFGLPSARKSGLEGNQQQERLPESVPHSSSTPSPISPQTPKHTPDVPREKSEKKEKRRATGEKVSTGEDSSKQQERLSEPVPHSPSTPSPISPQTPKHSPNVHMEKGERGKDINRRGSFQSVTLN
jgi:hypothetical protein